MDFKNKNMVDVNGIEIMVGQKVKTQQPSGGFLQPAPAQIGEVVYMEFNEKNLMCIKFRKEGQDFDRYISLEGKINQIMDEQDFEELNDSSWNSYLDNEISPDEYNKQLEDNQDIYNEYGY